MARARLIERHRLALRIASARARSVSSRKTSERPNPARASRDNKGGVELDDGFRGRWPEPDDGASLHHRQKTFLLRRVEGCTSAPNTACLPVSRRAGPRRILPCQIGDARNPALNLLKMRLVSRARSRATGLADAVRSPNPASRAVRVASSVQARLAGQVSILPHHSARLQSTEPCPASGPRVVTQGPSGKQFVLGGPVPGCVAILAFPRARRRFGQRLQAPLRRMWTRAFHSSTPHGADHPSRIRLPPARTPFSTSPEQRSARARRLLRKRRDARMPNPS